MILNANLGTELKKYCCDLQYYNSEFIFLE